MSTTFFIFIEFICYDDGCHLKKYACNPTRRDQTGTAKKLAEMSIVIDKMHMAGHVDDWCKKNCDPKNFKELNDVIILTISIICVILIVCISG